MSMKELETPKQHVYIDDIGETNGKSYSGGYSRKKGLKRKYLSKKALFIIVSIVVLAVTMITLIF